MKTYEVSDADGVVVNVTEADLQNAILSPHHLSVELMHAAGRGSFHLLVPKIIDTLKASEPIQRRVAARALLSLNSTSSIEHLLNLAEVEKNNSIAHTFRAVALRLQSVDQVRVNFFNTKGDPTFPPYLISNYNSNLKATKNDFHFLLDALSAYNNHSESWIINNSRIANTSDVDTILLYLLAEYNTIRPFICSLEEQQRTIAIINDTMEKFRSRDIQKLCKKLLKRIESIQPDPSLSPH